MLLPLTSTKVKLLWTEEQEMEVARFAEEFTPDCRTEGPSHSKFNWSEVKMRDDHK